MQKFDTRNTYKPINISHVYSNCDQVLKDPREKVGVLDLKKLNGIKIHSSTKAKDCILLGTFRTFLIQRRGDISSNVFRHWFPYRHFS